MPRHMPSREFPDTPAARRARALWGLLIGLLVGFVAALFHLTTRNWAPFLVRVLGLGILFALLGAWLGDRFWRNVFLALCLLYTLGLL